MSVEEKLLIRLLEKNAISETTGVIIKRDKTLKPLLNAGIIKGAKEDKVYLSEMGYKIAKGAKDIYRK